MIKCIQFASWFAWFWFQLSAVALSAVCCFFQSAHFSPSSDRLAPPQELAGRHAPARFAPCLDGVASASSVSVVLLASSGALSFAQGALWLSSHFASIDKSRTSSSGF